MFLFSIFDGVRDTSPDSHIFTWNELCDTFIGMSQERYARSAKLNRMAYIPGLLSGSRRASNVMHLAAGSYDIDIASSDPKYVPFEAMKGRLDASGLSYILVTSTKSLMSDHRYRLILPFERAVSACHHVEMWQHVNAEFGGIFDSSTHDSSRLSFFPADWHGLPCDSKGQVIRDWPEQEAFQAFACNHHGRHYPIPPFLVQAAPSQRSPGITRQAPRTTRLKVGSDAALPSKAAQNLLQECAALVPPRHSPGYLYATRPGNPLYCGDHEFGQVQDGRMFRFLSATAARALGRKLPINADLLHDLADAVDRDHGGGGRADLMREVERALTRQAERIATLPIG